MSEKATIYETRREMLVASTGDKRKAFRAAVTAAPIHVWWGLAVSEHQFLLALAEVFTVDKLTKDALQTMMADELSKVEDS